jgi:hypothetical protein
MARIAIAAVLALLALAAPAQAFQTCLHSGTTVTATYGSETTGTLRQSGTAIHSEDGACDGATTANTETIQVVGDPDAETLTIDLVGGLFVGGAAEGDGSNEVEFTVDFGPQSTPPFQEDSFFPMAPKEVTVVGTAGVEDVTVETYGPGNDQSARFTAINLNAGGSSDTDVTFDDRRFVEVRGEGGSDVLSGLVLGLDSASRDPMPRFVGGPGDDDLESGYTVPGPGDDTIRNVVNDETTASYLDAPNGTSIELFDGPGNLAGGTTPGGDGESTPGTDTYQGEPRIVGSDLGNDVLDATARPASAFRGVYVFGAGGDDSITGGEASIDSLIGGDGADTLDGLGMADLLLGGEGNDTLRGGGGTDTLVGNAGDDDEFGGPGFDTFHESSFEVFPESERGAPNGADDFHGGADRDTILYGDQDNFLDPPFVGRTAGVSVDFDDLPDDGAPGEGDNVHADVEGAGGGLGNDSLFGNASENSFFGLVGADLVDVGGGGADFVFCSDDDDTVHADAEDTLSEQCNRVDDPGGDPPPPDGGGGGGGDQTPAPPTDPPTSPPLVTPPIGPPVTPPAAAPPVSQLLSLPSSRRCASRRKFTVRVRRAIRGTVRRVQIFINGKRVKTVTGSRIGLPIDLRGLPKGRIRVRLRVELADGRVATDTRTYRTCATRKRRGRFGRRRG